MNLISEELREQLLSNGRCSNQADFDPFPVLKLFTPDGAATWLLTEIDPDDHDRAFGLCDLGRGLPELGWVRVSQLETATGWAGLGVRRDENFKPKKAISEYAEEARLAGKIRA
jgi:hypothetical protein